MQNRFAVLVATAMLAFAVPAALDTAPADAMPVAQPLPLADAAPPAVILTSGGCGPFRHRTFYGFCRPNFYGGYGFRRFGYGFGPYGYRRFGYGYRRFGYGYGYRRFYGFHRFGRFGWHRGYGFHRRWHW